MGTPRPVRTTPMPVFRRLLLNSLVGSVMSSFVWFAITFWVYLETRSVVATGVIGGAFALLSALAGMLFGTFVDRHRKHTAMAVAGLAAFVLYGLALAHYATVGRERLLDLSSPHLWLFVGLVMTGSVFGNLRAIALSTSVTLLVPVEHRDRANGMVGTVLGISFTITSVASGLVIGRLGMGWAMSFAVVATAGALVHLATIRVPEERPAIDPDAPRASAMDFRGAYGAIVAVPGLLGLVAFAAFNNLLGGVFMSLMDAYGLSLVSVEAWGVMFAVLSLGYIGGGMVVARRGLGPRPLRMILIGNAVNWCVCAVFTLQSNVLLLAAGMLVWLAMMPAIEAAEQTVLQRVVPFEQQGRVFGFAQTVENAAAPLTAFLIGPIAEVFVIPFMSEGGTGADLIGGWFGTGQDRAIALVFTAAGLLGLVATFLAATSRWYREVAKVAAAPAAHATPVAAADLDELRQ